MFPDDQLLGYLVMAAVAAAVLGVGLLVASTVAPNRPPLPVRPGASIATHYREGVVALRESQPFRVLLGAFMLQGLATGLMLAAAQFVARWVLGDEGAVTPLFVALIAPALLMAPVWKLVADRVGKERGFRLASAIFLIATVVLGLMVWMPGWWILAPVALAGAAYAGMQTLPMAMLPDVIAYDRSAAGSANRSGVFSGVWTAGETTGMALGATVLSLVLAVTGYIETTAEVEVSQPDAAVAGIAVAFSLLPALLMLISLVVLARYRLREQDIVGTSA
jgi:Na+/melibiose symporter-like transporter